MPDPNTELPTFSLEDLSFSSSNSTAVVSEAHKFILPIPDLGQHAEPLIYPEDHPEAGQPILDYKGHPVGEWGLVFFNAKDQSWQAVLGNGVGVIIINEVTPEQATQLDRKVKSLSPELEDLTIDQTKAILDYAQDSLGLVDVYNSTRDYVHNKLVPVTTNDNHPPSSVLEAAYGYKKRTSDDVYQALYISGGFLFKGSTNTVQRFDTGGVILEQQGNMKGIQPDVFMRTYRRLDGQAIQSIETDIKTAQMG